MAYVNSIDSADHFHWFAGYGISASVKNIFYLHVWLNGCWKRPWSEKETVPPPIWALVTWSSQYSPHPLNVYSVPSGVLKCGSPYAVAVVRVLKRSKYIWLVLQSKQRASHSHIFTYIHTRSLTFTYCHTFSHGHIEKPIPYRLYFLRVCQLTQ